MRLLLDTNVVSELRKAASGKADAHVARWAAGLDPAEAFLSVISVMELELGVGRIERRDAAQGALLRRWLENQVLPGFQGRILPVSLEAARRCALLHLPDPRPERAALIAATALVHGLVLATRNRADFAPVGVMMVNPWEDQALGAARP